MYNYQWSCLLAVFTGIRVSADELDIIIKSYYLATSVRLDVSFGYLSRFIVEETVRVSSPSYTSHVDSKMREVQIMILLTRISVFQVVASFLWTADLRHHVARCLRDHTVSSALETMPSDCITAVLLCC